MGVLDWWHWERAFSPHVAQRVAERASSGVEAGEVLACLREMRYGRDGRWRVGTRHGGRNWLVVVDADEHEKVAFVVTAYPR